MTLIARIFNGETLSKEKLIEAIQEERKNAHNDGIDACKREIKCQFDILAERFEKLKMK